MKKRLIPLSLALLITLVAGCDNSSSLISSSNTDTITSSDTGSNTSTTGGSSTTTTTTSISHSEVGEYDTLEDCNNAAVGKNVHVLATITGTDGSGYFLQDNTGEFYAYYGDNAPKKTIGNIYEIKGNIGEYAGNKQIAKDASIVDTGSKGDIRIKEANSYNDLNTYKYSPVKLTVKLDTLASYSSGKDTRINVDFNGQTLLVFFKRFIANGDKIVERINSAGAGNKFVINGGFATAYQGSPQVVISDPNQIEVSEITTEEQKLEYARGLIFSLTDLNGKKIYTSQYFPTSGDHGITFAYESSNTSILSNNGNVTRPENTDSSVTLTIKIYLDGVLKETLSVSFTVVAKGSSELSDEAKKYYSSIDFSTSGATLKTSLYNLISNHTVVAYGNLASVYADSDTYVGEDGQTYLVDIYSNQKYTLSDSGSSASNEGEGWNREHTIPQSWFNKQSPMVSDAFHIYPTDIKVNSMRGSYLYGEVSNARFTSSNGCKVGSSATSGISGTVFEVADEYKGDIARTYFYMVTAYENKAGSWGNHFSNNDFSKLTSASLKLFMKWAEEDPVSEREILRNNGIYKHQKNRNPYIDVPDLAERVFSSLL